MAPMRSALLALNAGSSSLKFALYARHPALPVLARGRIEAIGTHATLHAAASGASDEVRALPQVHDMHAALQAALDWIVERYPSACFAAIGHRVVHGGMHHAAPVLVDDALLDELEALDPLAPLHQPFNLDAIRAMRARFPDTRAVACFDTAFHAGWQDRFARIPLPRRFHDGGIRRYGFHGLSYEFLAGRMRELAPSASRVVLAHLGSGASVCALRDGSSIDCTMGFSALEGLPMATRCGSIDPAIVFHLHRQGMAIDAIEAMLYRESGLLGIAQTSGDVRDLLASERTEAREALDIFTQRVACAIGAAAVTLGGIDALVFSGGVGANSAAVRAAICEPLAFLGIALDAPADATNAPRIAAASSVPVFALPTDEERVIAKACYELLRRTEPAN